MHLLTLAAGEEDDKEPPCSDPGPKPTPPSGDLARLPPPVSHILGRCTENRLSSKGRSILHAIQAPVVNERPRYLPRREAILRALTDDAYA